MAKPQSSYSVTDDPQWYKDAIIYELHVKSFHDSNGDGIGDFKGVTKKLDYLRSLGVTALWLLPFYPSPLRDDGYDIADYYDIHPQYGTMADFKEFLHEARRLKLRVITELVVNHTSNIHPWFQKSRAAKPGSYWRNFYVWSDSQEKYADTRIIFTDSETSNWTWDPVAKAYFWHRFYSHQPDLNFANANVLKEVLKALDFWFEMGVDGMRLDAIPYLCEREGTNCENLPETFVILDRMRAHLDQKYTNKMLLAEANQWPEDTVEYFGAGNRCHMAFHFPLMPRMFMASKMEDRFPIVDIIEQTPAIPETCQWALFLRNHDELTLEMVSDEERDFMYRVYASDSTARINVGIRRRLAPLFDNNRRKIELMYIMLFSLPGTPVIYYGDEIGMGDNHYLGDRNGVRTPMQWSSDRNAGFSLANPQKLFLPIIIDPDYHYETVNVDHQERNQSSMLWWMRRVITTRKRFQAFSRGSIEFLPSDNFKTLAFIRQYQDEHLLVIINLSRFSQAVQLDLSRYAGYVPEEVVSGNKFPIIKTDPYNFTLGFHDYFWFILKQERKLNAYGESGFVPEIKIAGALKTILGTSLQEHLEQDILPAYLPHCRWFAGKAKIIKKVMLQDDITLGADCDNAHLIILEVNYVDGDPEFYFLPLVIAPVHMADKLTDVPRAIFAHLITPSGRCIVYDGIYNEALRNQLLRMITSRQTFKTKSGQLSGYSIREAKVKKSKAMPHPQLKSHLLSVEQSNSSILYDEKYFLKLYRRLETGINPELEIGRFLTERQSFSHTPAFAGAMEYRRPDKEVIVLGILQKYVRNESNAWDYSLAAISRYFEQILARHDELAEIPVLPSSFLMIAAEGLPPLIQELIGGVYLEKARLLGKRTGELHLALADAGANHAFAPEAFSLLYQQSLFHAMRTQTKKVFTLLRKSLPTLRNTVKSDAEMVLGKQPEIIKCFERLTDNKITAMKIRIHGDYHLGQVLYTGNDFSLIDFEGEPARSIGERRLKRSPLRDVAGMIRSFHYPGYATLFNSRSYSSDHRRLLAPWAEIWYQGVAATFLHHYLDTTQNSSFIPQEKRELELLLQTYMLEKTIYEIGYELNNRPDWLIIPLQGIKKLIEG